MTGAAARGPQVAPGAPEAPPALSVIIPAYNEQQRLPQHLGPVLAYLRAHYPSFELIVVDDGSGDDTAAAVGAVLAGEPRARVLAYQPNRGKGYAVRQGIMASRGQVVIFLDADLSTPIEEIPRALERLEQADIVIGSRDLPSSQIGIPQPLFRRVASEVFRWARNLALGLWHIADTQCGFKAYRGPLARRLFRHAQVDRFMFDVEVLYLADRAGLRIVEVPVQWNDATGSKVKFWQGLREMVHDLWRIRRLHGKSVIED